MALTCDPLNKEIRYLSDFKDNCDHALAAKAIPEAVCAENLGFYLNIL